MSRKWLELLGFAAIAALFFVAGCAESAVGDPCVPEKVYEGGFLASETYLELSSVQCATRVCLVRELEGDPNQICTGVDDSDECVTENDIERSVYCSCRCDAPEGSSLPTCGCPGGFICEPILETGGDGLRGSYCVRDPTLEVQ
ncbi:MAG: hypothetical protein OEQ49_15395 [Myxococcales bacterium]|nr:hypothetical protein [Myxococcales bacterium]